MQSSWNKVRRMLDEFLISEKIPEGTSVPEIYNRFIDRVHAPFRNPENVERILDYLSSYGSYLWDDKKKEGLAIMIRADREYERKHHIDL